MLTDFIENLIFLCCVSLKFSLNSILFSLYDYFVQIVAISPMFQIVISVLNSWFILQSYQLILKSPVSYVLTWIKYNEVLSKSIKIVEYQQRFNCGTNIESLSFWFFIKPVLMYFAVKNVFAIWREMRRNITSRIIFQIFLKGMFASDYKLTEAQFS